MVKVNIPEKVCIVCNRPFSYRKNGGTVGMK